MKYSQKELRSKDHALLRRTQRMSEVNDEGFLNGKFKDKKDKDKKIKVKKFTRLHLYLNNSRSKGRN